MADTKFTALPVGSAIVDTDIFASSQDITTTPISKKITGTQLKTYIGAPNPFDQSLNTTDNVNFLNVTGSALSGTSLIDTVAAGGGTTNVQMDNAGKLIRSTSGGNTRSVYFSLETNGEMDGYRTRNIGASGNFEFNFAIPDDFSSLVSIGLIGWSTSAGGAGAGKNVDLTSSYGGLGENFAQHSETDLTSTYDFGTEDDKFELDLSSVFSSLSATDTCTVNVSHDGVGGIITYIFIKLVYLI